MNAPRASQSILFILALLCLIPNIKSLAEDANSPFQIRMVRRTTKAVAETKNGWKNGAACIGVDVYLHEMPKNEGPPQVKVYFFDKEGAVIERRSKASQVSDDSAKYSADPEHWQAKKVYSLFYTITENLENNDHKFARVLVVFCNDKQGTAKVFPSGDPKDFTFREKERVMKSMAAPPGS